MKVMIMATVAFNTLGCKVNQYETESMMAQFELAGYEIVAFSEKSDVYIVNTCTVTNMADKKSRQMLSKAKKNNADALVVAVGCYVQASESALSEVDHVDLLVGNNDKGHIVSVVEAYLKDHVVPKVKDLSHYRTYDDMWLSHASGHTRVHVKVQDGCDQFCTYCIIPFARGRIRSRSLVSVVEEVKSFVEQGYKEVVLTGIHLASYEDGEARLIDLLEALNDLEGLERIRLGSLEPTLVDEGFVKRLAGAEKVCDHFHLSMQSGDDTTLKGMNRRYTTQMYKHAVALLREVYPTCGVTTDLIVGFPGEEDAHFTNTLDFLKVIGFADVHVFKYSKRDGTVAAKRKDQVSPHIKNARSHEAMTLVDHLKERFLEKFLNTELKVLTEEGQKIDGVAYRVGHASNHIKVYVADANEGRKLNQIDNVLIEKTFKDGLLGVCI